MVVVACAEAKHALASDAGHVATQLGVGSHVTLRHRDDSSRRATVPVHPGKDIPPGTLRSILRGARLDVEEIRELL